MTGDPMLRASGSSAGDAGSDETGQLRDDEIHHRVGDPRVNADPERLAHRDVGVDEVPDDPALDSLVSRLSQRVAREDLPRGDAARFQVRDDVNAGEGSFRPPRVW